MEKIKRVLSIDMDYIVPDCIQLYNDLAGLSNMREGCYWDNVKRERNLEKFLSYDEKQYELVRELVKKNAPNIRTENIMFALEHDMILELLCDVPEKKDELLEVYNLDHHHDIYYGAEENYQVEHYQVANIGDWVYYLGFNKKLYKYNWLRNYSSDRFDDELQAGLDFIVTQDKLIESPDKILEIDFDYLFVCKSEEYLPDNFWHLFEELRHITEDIKGERITVWDKPYCIDGCTRFVAGKEPTPKQRRDVTAGKTFWEE